MVFSSCLSSLSPRRFWIFQCGLYAALFLLINSCISPDPLTELSVEDKDVYVTNRDTTVDFSQYRTYAIVDSVKFVSRSFDSAGTTVSSSPLILSTVNEELQRAGFVRTDTSQHPDVGISVTVLRFEDEVPVQYYPYVGGAYFGYPATAFYGFPGYAYAYPGYYGYYQIDIGSISIEMFDLKTARQSKDKKLNIIWSAVLAGSLADTGSNNGERIVKAIRAAFDQSPYLKK
jgi:hypothetical protein